MYDHLLGEIVEKHASRAVVRCAGVGYDVRVSLNSATDLVVGQTQKLFTILNVVDGTPSLLGFSSQAERELALVVARGRWQRRAGHGCGERQW